MAEPNGTALSLHEQEYLNTVLDGLEQEAFEFAVNARPSDDEQRRVGLAEVRAIRSLRGKLLSLSKGTTKPPKRGSVA